MVRGQDKCRKPAGEEKKSSRERNIQVILDKPDSREVPPAEFSKNEISSIFEGIFHFNRQITSRVIICDGLLVL